MPSKKPSKSHAAPVGLVGIGLMGESFARLLLKAGQRVVGTDIDAAKRAKLEELGGTAGTLATIAKTCNPILVIVFNTEQVEDVIENHLLPALGEASNKIVMVASTCDPDRIAALAKRVKPRGIRFLETPVSGTSQQLRDGDGVGLIGGDPEIAAEIAPILDIIYPKRFHIGKEGDGGRAKLAINLILGINRAALAEGLVFAEKIGLDAAAFLKVAQGSAAYSQVMDTKGAKIVRRDFTTEARARQTLKDAKLMLELADRIGQQLPMLSAHADLLEACVKHGDGDKDNSVVAEEIRRRTKPKQG